ncbi:hypothetical protein ACNOIU_07110 [Exiguobacterium mexicanum]|uniref:Uncharacterized protein n=1 Tax=Exiguobacterium mexicanum TaxID=340146 RepID=A0ABT7MPJ9_9BACL|nr:MULTISPECIES: hypothetical protein [Exiguobacterium]MDL5377131.1 hypothetical protein [Exiguobacterium mexicanum]
MQILMDVQFFKWNGDFGWSDLISAIAAILTLIAVFISAKASKSAQKSAEISSAAALLADEQTKLMREELEYNQLPTVLPIQTHAKLNLQSITSYSKEDLNPYTGTIHFSLVNIGQGNAYNINSWFNLEDKDFLFEHNPIKSGVLYNQLFNSSGYLLRFEKDYKTKVIGLVDTLNITFIDEDSIRRLSIDDSKNYNTYLRNNETFKVNFPSFAQVIIVDHALRRKNYFHQYVAKKVEGSLSETMSPVLRSFEEADYINLINNLTLNVKYKTEKQLKTNSSLLIKYKMSVTETKIESVVSASVAFKISFNYLSEEIIEDVKPDLLQD